MSTMIRKLDELDDAAVDEQWMQGEELWSHLGRKHPMNVVVSG